MRVKPAHLWILLWAASPFAILGGTILLTFTLTAFNGVFWLVAVSVCVVSTAYWLCHGRRGPNRDSELTSLFALYALLANILIFNTLASLH